MGTRIVTIAICCQRISVSSAPQPPYCHKAVPGSARNSLLESERWNNYCESVNTEHGDNGTSAHI